MMNTPESQVAAAHDAWVRAGQRLVATDKSLSAERRLLELQAKLCKNMESERTHLEFLVRIKLAHKRKLVPFALAPFSCEHRHPSTHPRINPLV